MSKTSPDRAAIQIVVQIIVEDPDSVEILQSASIVYRELLARGLKANMNGPVDGSPDCPLAALPGAETIVSITIGNRGLQNGAVEFITREPKSLKISKQDVLLEDVVDRVWEFVHEKH
jgi:hypothetical protein